MPLRRLPWTPRFELLCEFRRRYLEAPAAAVAGWLWPAESRDDRARRERPQLELKPLDFRNPSSEGIVAAAAGIAGAGLALGLTAAVYGLPSSFGASAPAETGNAAAAGGGASDLPPAPGLVAGVPSTDGPVLPADPVEPVAASTGVADEVGSFSAAPPDAPSPVSATVDPLAPPPGGDASGPSASVPLVGLAGEGDAIASTSPTGATGGYSSVADPAGAGLPGPAGSQVGTTDLPAAGTVTPPAPAPVDGYVGQPRPAGGAAVLADPIRFTTNRGQWADGVAYGAAGAGYGVGLAADRATLAAGGGTLDLAWIGADPRAAGTVETALGSVSRFAGGPAVPDAAAVRFAGVWDGVDLVYSGADGRALAFAVHVAPGADLAGVGFRVGGAAVDAATGDLVAGGLRLTAPVAYQTAADGARTAVGARFDVRADGGVGFALGAYDPAHPLVIDPTVTWSTDGSADEGEAAVKVDRAGNTYTGGWADVGGGVTQGVVTKRNAAGAPVWTTYLGSGTAGATAVAALDLDAAGNVAVAGWTAADGVAAGGGWHGSRLSSSTTRDGFAARLDAAGGLTWGTYLGGVGTDQATGVAFTPGGGVAVVGWTESSDMATAAAAQPTLGGAARAAFVAALAADGSAPTFSTYLRGTSAASEAAGVAVGPGGDLYVAGGTDDPGFAAPGGWRTAAAKRDAFVVRYASGGAQLAATLYGGTGNDTATGVAWAPGVGLVVAGTTASTDLPTVAAVQNAGHGGTDLFLARFDSLGAAPAYSTYLGGVGDDAGGGVAVDGSNRITVAGTTASPDFTAAGTPLSGPNQFVARTDAGGAAVPDLLTWPAGGSLTDSPFGAGGPAAAAGDDRFAAAGSLGGGAHSAARAVLLRGATDAPAVTAYLDGTSTPVVGGLTGDATPTLVGTAAAGSTVEVFRELAGGGLRLSLGTTTADGSGDWSLTSATPLADGGWRFSATAAASGEAVSEPSAALAAAVDTTPPTVSISLDPSVAGPTDLLPALRATVRDASGTAAAIAVDVDYDGDGLYTGAELAAQVGTVVDGTFLFKAYPAVSVGTTVHFRSRILDRAGNQGLTAPLEYTPAPTGSDLLVAPLIPADRYLAADPATYAGNVTAKVPVKDDVAPASCGCQDAALVYDGGTADPLTVLAFGVGRDSASGVPEKLLATLTVDGTQLATYAFGYPDIKDTQLLYRPSPGGDQGGPDTLELKVPKGGWATTGRHTYDLNIGTVYADSSRNKTATLTNQTFFVVNDAASPYGAGWRLSNVDTMVPVAASGSLAAGLLRVVGRGGWAFYEEASVVGSVTHYTSPAGDHGTLVRDATTGLTEYTAADGKTQTFDPAGRMVEWKSRDGQEAFSYEYGSGGRLGTMTADDGSVNAFTYSGGKLTGIDSPAGHTAVTVDSSGDLASVTDPAGGLRCFTYASHRLTGDAQGGLQTDYAYDANGLLASVTAGGTTRLVEPALSHTDRLGFLGLRGGRVDGGGHRSETLYNPQGDWTAKVQPSGATQLVQRNAAGEVTKSTDAELASTTTVRNAAGLPTAVTLPGGGTRTMAYSGPFNDLVGWTDENGRRGTATYDGAGHVQTIRDPFGTTSYDWAANGLLRGVTDPLSRTTSFQYDAQRRLVNTVRPGLPSGTLLYDAAGYRAGVLDGQGHTTTWVNDAAGHRLAEVRPGTAPSTTVYDAAGLPVGRIDPAGVRTSSVYDGAGRLLAETVGVGTAHPLTTSRVYDAAGYLAALVAPDGLRTSFGYDADGNLASVTSPSGATSRTAYDLDGRPVAETDPAGRTTRTAYDADGRVLATTDPLGNTTSFGYDAAGNRTVRVDDLGRRTTTVYDALNRAVATWRRVGGADVRGTTVYDAAGQVVASIDPLGRTTSFGYDPASRLVAVTDPLGRTTTTVYDSVDNIVATVDPLARATSFGYDAADRRVTVTDPLSRTSTTVYDGAGRVLASVDPLGRRTTAVYDDFGRMAATKDAGGFLWSTVYDEFGRVAATVDPLGRTATTVYDEFGRPAGAVDPLGRRARTLYDEFDQVVATVDATGFATSVGYDGAGRTAVVVDAAGGRWETGYDAVGNAVASVDPLGRRVTTAYDELDRAVATWRRVGGADVRGTTVYDAASQVVASVDPLGRRTTWGYDLAGQAVTATDPLNRTTTTVYDAAGQQVASVDPLNRRTTWGYDAAGQAVTVRDALNRVTTTAYDAAGQVTAVTDPLNRTTSWVYDAVGQPTAVRDPLNRVTTTVYDAAGQATKRIDPLNHATTSGYDAAGQVVAVTDATGRTTTTVYDERGLVVASVDPLGHGPRFAYDRLGRPVYQADALGNAVRTAYDAAGNAVATTDPLGRTTTAVYDELDRAVASVDPLANRSTAVYDVASQLLASVDPLGRRTTWGYDAAGQAITLRDPLNRVTTTAYDAAGQAVAVTDPLNRTTTTVYDAAGQQVASRDPLNRVTTTVYDAAGQVIASVDPLGRRTTWSYDAAGQAVAVTDPLNRRTTSVYDAAGNVVATVDALNHRSTTVYDEADRVVATVDALGNRTTTGYDLAGNAVSVKNPRGYTTTTAYDAADRPVATVDALGNAWTTVYDAAGNAVASVDPLSHRGTTVYDALDRAVAAVDALGNRTTTLYDAAGQVTARVDALNRRTSWSYDAAGQAVEVRNALGFRTTSVYDAAGQVIASVDPLGRRTTWSYDAAGQAVEVRNALGFRTTSVYDAAGQRVATVDPLNDRTTTVYDAAGQVVATIDALGNRTTTGYDLAGNAVSVQNRRGYSTTTAYDAADRPVATIDALGYPWTTVYDAAGNAVATVDPRGNRTTTAYDALDRAVSVTDALGFRSTAVYDPAGRLARTVDQAGYATTFVYDAADRRTEVRRPTGAVATTAYDAVGNATVQIDPLGRRTTAAYDALDRATATTAPTGATVTMLFDAAGNRTVLIDPNGNRTTTAYDALNRPTQELDPLGAAAGFAYDAAGRLAATTDRLGRDKQFTYDALGRATVEAWYDHGLLTQAHTFSYDANGNVLTAADPDGTYTIGYDALDRPWSRSAGVNGPFGVYLGFAYDAAGNRVLVTDSLGGVQTSTFDALDRVASRAESDAKGGLRLEWAYTPRGPVGTLTRYDAATGGTAVGDTVYAYDAGGRTTAVTHRDAAAAAVLTLTTAYDLADRPTSDWTNGAVTGDYAYDAAGQLTGDGTTAQSYDPAGNRNGGGYAVGAGNRVTGDGRYTYTYDAAGQRTGKADAAGNAWAYTYDHDGHLTRLDQTSGGRTLVQRTEFAYDAFGNRVGRTVLDGSLAVVTDERYVVDGWNPAKDDPAPAGTEDVDVWADLGGSNALAVHRVAGDGIDDVQARIDSTGPVFALADRQGSVRAAYAGGAVAGTYAYDGFGQVTTATGAVDRYAYTGREYEAAAGGMTYLRDRLLSHDTGTFLGPDRLPTTAPTYDPNATRYVRNGFTYRTDPSGKDYVTIINGQAFMAVQERSRFPGCDKTIVNILIGDIITGLDGKRKVKLGGNLLVDYEFLRDEQARSKIYRGELSPEGRADSTRTFVLSKAKPGAAPTKGEESGIVQVVKAIDQGLDDGARQVGGGLVEGVTSIPTALTFGGVDTTVIVLDEEDRNSASYRLAKWGGPLPLGGALAKGAVGAAKGGTLVLRAVGIIGTADVAVVGGVGVVKSAVDVATNGSEAEAESFGNLGLVVAGGRVVRNNVRNGVDPLSFPGCRGGLWSDESSGLSRPGIPVPRVKPSEFVGPPLPGGKSNYENYGGEFIDEGVRFIVKKAIYKFEQHGITYRSVIEAGRNGETLIDHYITHDGRDYHVGTSTISKNGELTHAVHVPEQFRRMGVLERMYEESGRVGFKFVRGSYNPGADSVNYNTFIQHYNPAKGNAVEALFETPSGRVMKKLGFKPTNIKVTENNVDVTWVKE